MNRNLEELQSELKSEKDSVFIQYTSQYFISSSCNVLQCVVEYFLNHNLIFSLVFFTGSYALIFLHLPELANWLLCQRYCFRYD